MSKNQSPQKTPEEWFRIITECRQSGLSDSAWCLQKGISRSTFSEAASRLRKMSYAIPKRHCSKDSLDFTSGQEVVGINITQELTPVNHAVPASVMPAAASASSYIDNSHTIEVQIGDAIIRLSNNADPTLAGMITASLLKGGCYAC